MGLLEMLEQDAREEGVEKGRMKERESFVRRLLSDTAFSMTKIAALAGVSTYFVRKVKQERKRFVHSASR